MRKKTNEEVVYRRWELINGADFLASAMRSDRLL